MKGCALRDDVPASCRSSVAYFQSKRTAARQNPLTGILFDCPASLQRYLAKCRPKSHCLEPGDYSWQEQINCTATPLLKLNAPDAASRRAFCTASFAHGNTTTPSCHSFCQPRFAELHCQQCKCLSCSFCWTRQKPMDAELRRIGALLLAAFTHVSIISLPRSWDRRSSIRSLLRDTLGMREGIDFSFILRPADCLEYGKWNDLTSPLPSASSPVIGERVDRARKASSSTYGHWWLHNRTCKRTDVRHQFATRGGCLMPDLVDCRHLRGNAVSKCGGICYTLSVLSAMREFLETNRSRMLLVEDDLCLTQALRSAQSVLLNLSAHDSIDSTWQIARVGHCFQKVRLNHTTVVKRDEGCDRSSEYLQEHQARVGEYHHQVLSGSSLRILPGLGRSFCTHALGLDRAAAARMLSLAFPVTAVFDDLLFAADGGYGAGAQQEVMRRAGLKPRSIAELKLVATEMHAVHLTDSLFAQRSKDSQMGMTSLTQWRLKPTSNSAK